MSRLKNNKRPVIYEDGKQSRDFISVHDIVQANILAMEKSEGDYQAFNVGSGIGTSIKRIALTLSNILGTEHLSPDITGTYRQGDIRHSLADISRIKKTLGFKPSVSFQHGMEELVEWGRDREAIDRFAKAQSALQQRGLI
jgi:dTDP-L-rhamnose 4-epimerase